jgi:hypothetical protein
VSVASDIDLYGLLGVAPDASDDEIQAAYRLAAQAWHSDRWGGASEAQQARAEEMMKRLNAARDTLLDSEQRAAYDRTRQGAGAASGEPGARSDTLLVPCARCRTPRWVERTPSDRAAYIECVHCGETSAAAVGIECVSQKERAAGDGFQTLTVRARFVDGGERMLEIVTDGSVNVRHGDAFSLVGDEPLTAPRLLVNHRLGECWGVGWPEPVQPAPASRQPVEVDWVGVLIGVVSWGIAFFLLRPAMGFGLYLGLVVVLTTLAAKLSGRSALAWCIGTVFSAGAAGFVLLCLRPPRRERPVGLAAERLRVDRPLPLLLDPFALGAGVALGIALVQVPPLASSTTPGAGFWGSLALIAAARGIASVRSRTEFALMRLWASTALLVAVPVMVAIALLLGARERPLVVGLVAAGALMLALGAAFGPRRLAAKLRQGRERLPARRHAEEKRDELVKRAEDR